jgi:hypothetical protein
MCKFVPVSFNFGQRTEYVIMNLYYSLRKECRRAQESVLPLRVRAPQTHVLPRASAPQPPAVEPSPHTADSPRLNPPPQPPAGGSAASFHPPPSFHPRGSRAPSLAPHLPSCEQSEPRQRPRNPRQPPCPINGSCDHKSTQARAHPPPSAPPSAPLPWRDGRHLRRAPRRSPSIFEAERKVDGNPFQRRPPFLTRSIPSRNPRHRSPIGAASVDDVAVHTSSPICVVSIPYTARTTFGAPSLARSKGLRCVPSVHGEDHHRRPAPPSLA